MNLNVEKNKTLFVVGPAFLSLLEGEACILAAPLQPNQKIKVRNGKATPIYCKKDSRFEITLGKDASIHMVDGSTIPQDWEKVSWMVMDLAEKQNLVVMVVGGVDVGKTSFTIFLINMAIKKSLKVSVVDADIGQSDVGPPTTVGVLEPEKYVYDLFCEKPSKIVFIGSTTPTNVQEKMVEVTSNLCLLNKQKFNLTILNTDGWINGEEAKNYKVNMAKKSGIDLAVVFYSSEEVLGLAEKLKENGLEVFKVESSPMVKKRSREERRKLRWQSYQKYMKDSTVRTIPLEKVKVLGLEEGWKEGLVVGLYDLKMNFVGLGVLKGINPIRKTVKILTPVKVRVGKIEVGKTVVDIDLKTQGEKQG